MAKPGLVVVLSLRCACQDADWGVVACRPQGSDDDAATHWSGFVEGRAVSDFATNHSTDNSEFTDGYESPLSLRAAGFTFRCHLAQQDRRLRSKEARDMQGCAGMHPLRVLCFGKSLVLSSFSFILQFFRGAPKGRRALNR